RPSPHRRRRARSTRKSRRPRTPSSKRPATRLLRNSVNAKRGSPRHSRRRPRRPSRRRRLLPKFRSAPAPPKPRRAPTSRRTRMAESSDKDIAALRKATGAGMMECKNALEEAEGDKERALDILRAKGLAKAGKLSDREATEGAVDVVVDGNVGAIVEVNCNTDFVAKGSEFTGLLADITKQVAANGDGDVAALPLGDSTVGATLQHLAGKICENV